MELAVYNIKGEKTAKTVVLNDEIFAMEPNDHAIYLDVKLYLANQRQGTHKAKERWEMSGSTRKLKKQKGTGGARAGDINSPVFKGGARVFGPRPRSYSFKLNKKVKMLARVSALTHKAKSDSIMIIEDVNFDQPRTKTFVELMKNFNITDKKSLLVLSESNKNVYLSARNLKQAKIAIASDLNTYDIMRASKLIFAESAIALLNS